MGDKIQKKMTPGTYMLRIYIEETRSLTMKKPGELNAVISCKIFGQTHKSKVHKNASCIVNHWKQNFFFIKQIENEAEVEDEIVEVEIKDSELLGDDPLIGRLEIDVMSIYRKNDEHTIKYQWAGLSNDDENFDSIKGYIKFSASFFTHGDIPVDLGDEPVAAAKPGGPPQQMLMPPQLKHTPYQMNIYVVKAEKLPKLDMIGTLDSYIMAEYASQHVMTEKFIDNHNPKYLAQIHLPYTEPSLSSILKLNFFDYEKYEEDKHFGTAMIHKDDFQKYEKLTWINIYGSEPELELFESSDESIKEIKTMMNQDPDLANYWLGRLLFKLETYKCSHPKHEVVEMSFENKDKRKTIKESFSSIKESVGKFANQDTKSQLEAKLTIKNYWQMIVEFHSGMYFPEEFDTYKLRFCWGEFHLDSKMVQALDPENNRKWYFYERLTIKHNLPYENDNFQELPDVFVYLINSKNEITGFYRRPAKEFMSHDRVPESIAFKPNHQKFPQMPECSAGTCNFRAYINYESTVMDKIKMNRWIKPLAHVERPQGILQINLYQANDILASDSDGLSSPYFKFYYNGKCIKSHEIKDTLSPIWDIGMKLEIDYFENIKSSPFIFIELFDKKLVGDDIMIGWARVQVKNYQVSETPTLISYPGINQKPVMDVKPDWVHLQHSEMPAGKALLSFVFLPKEYESLTQEDSHTHLELPSSEYKMKFRIIGLRGLVSSGILPIQKAFLTFDVQSLQKKQKVAEQKFMKTIPKQQGDSPNIISCLSTEVELPTDIDYMPNMQVYCYDSLMGGLTKSLIGNFQIDLKEAIGNTINRVNKIKEHQEELAREEEIKKQNEQKKLLKQQKVQQMKNTFTSMKKSINFSKKNEQSKPLLNQDNKNSIDQSQIQIYLPNSQQKNSINNQNTTQKKQEYNQLIEFEKTNQKDPNYDTIQKNSVQKDASQYDTIKKNSIQTKDPISKNSIQKDTNQKDTNQKEISQKNSIQNKDPIQNDSVKNNESIQNKDDNTNEIKKSQIKDKISSQVKQINCIKDSVQKKQDQIKDTNLKNNSQIKENDQIQNTRQDQIQTNMNNNDQDDKLNLKDIPDQNDQIAQTIIKKKSNLINNEQASIKSQKSVQFIDPKDDQNQIQQNSEAKNNKNSFKNNNLQLQEIKEHKIEQTVHSNKESFCLNSNQNDENQKMIQKDQPQKSIIEKPSQQDQPQEKPQEQEQPDEKDSQELDSQNQQEESGKPKIVIKVQYKKIKPGNEFQFVRYVENKVPDLKKYLAIGYDEKQIRVNENPEKYKRHYRLLLDHPLEDSEYMDKIVFSEIDIMHKNSLQKGGFFAQKLHMTQGKNPIRGVFKGWLDVYRLDYEKEYNKYITSSEDMAFLKSQVVYVRLYVYKFKDIVGIDSNGESSPYLKLKCGDFQVDEKDQYVENVDEFDKFQMYTFKAKIPGPPLQIQLWHHNMIEFDQEIGSNTLDLEDRWFSKKWKAKIEHPIETRQLINDDTQLSFGCVQCMCQIYEPKNEKKTPIWDLSTKPIKNFELRVVVWKSFNVEKVDGDFNDLKAKVKFGDIEQETDTHWRSQTGQGTWNWRIVIPCSYPLKDQDTQIRFQIDEESLLTSDEPISEGFYDIKEMLDIVYESNVVLKKKVNNELKFNIDTTLSPSFQNQKNEKIKQSNDPFAKISTDPESGGQLQVSIYLYPSRMALKLPQGLGRESPNNDPTLPSPPDRLKMSLNPFEMLDEFLSAQERFRLKILCGIIICVGLIVVMAPIIIANLITTGITSV